MRVVISGLRRQMPSLLCGALGFALLWGAWHLYIDHLMWHELLRQIVASQQRAAPVTK